MKNFLFLVLALVLIFTVSCSKNVTPTASDSGTTLSVLSLAPDWVSMTQTQRNSLIITTAKKYNNTIYTGQGQCKGWVQTVVLNASGGLVQLPANQTSPAGNEYKWVTSGSGTPQYILYPNSCVPIQYAQPGCIVQMYFKTLSTTPPHVDPHTMIILAVNQAAGTMDIIDCNRSATNAVSIYYGMTFAYFYAHVSDINGNINSSYYTLYYVL